jgi:hypothetical protein
VHQHRTGGSAEVHPARKLLDLLEGLVCAVVHPNEQCAVEFVPHGVALPRVQRHQVLDEVGKYQAILAAALPQVGRDLADERNVEGRVAVNGDALHPLDGRIEVDLDCCRVSHHAPPSSILLVV